MERDEVEWGVGEADVNDDGLEKLNRVLSEVPLACRRVRVL